MVDLEPTCRVLEPFDELGKDKPLLTSEEFLKHCEIVVKTSNQPVKLDIVARLCRHAILSMDSTSREHSLAVCFLNRATIVQATATMTDVVTLVVKTFPHINTEKVSEVKNWHALIHFLIVMSSANGWAATKNAAPTVMSVLNDSLCVKLLAPLYNKEYYCNLGDSLYKACNSQRPILNLEAVNALFSLLLRPLRNGDDEMTECFSTHVLTCPALFMHISQQHREALVSSCILARSLRALRRNLLEDIDPRRTVCMLGNLVQLASIDLQSMQNCVFDWTWAVGITLAHCSEFAVQQHERTSLSYWHPIFGHYKIAIDANSEGALRNVSRQLQLLWSKDMVTNLFAKALEDVPVGGSKSSGSSSGPSSSNDVTVLMSKLWQRVHRHRGSGVQPMPSSTRRSSCDVATLAAVICELYMRTIATMQHNRNEILSGICRDDGLLSHLWNYLVKWGRGYDNDPQAPLMAALRCLPREADPSIAPLELFCDACAYLVSIVDEEDLYDRGIPFQKADLARVARMCNSFCFRVIWYTAPDEKLMDRPLFASVQALCAVLYARDSRRPFQSDEKFWLAPDVKPSAIVGEIERKTARATLLVRKMSWTIPLKERMQLFRKYLAAEKASIDSPATLITIMRGKIVEDAFRQLGNLPPEVFKATIRVKFVNQEGLAESGIDQTGILKEFLEQTLRALFAPQLNLFVCTSSGRLLYPSNTSHVQDDHLALFHFTGRLLAKAVFEGMVIDEVELAPVLLSAVLGCRRPCAFDELTQLDPELYKNLSYVKRFDDNVEDLSLTFSMDEDMLGKVRTVDLVAGGRTIAVTNENRIEYVHRMAHHRVFRQTAQQCKAFVSGFQSVLRESVLQLFAPHELQRVISGQKSDLDLSDLKKHTQYYGGFHSSHRVIKWLWDVVEKDFDANERKLFLKFVTSCSRPPLLGFSQLEPPFSIRCVEVSDDQDQGDTLASVVRGFLALKKSSCATRLPTASTCFNLLKLPNYSKKSVLLSKLRYAIHSETGFELS